MVAPQVVLAQDVIPISALETKWTALRNTVQGHRKLVASALTVPPRSNTSKMPCLVRDNNVPSITRKHKEKGKNEKGAGKKPGIPLTS